MFNLLRKWFLVREIRSKAGVLHFRRWRLVQTSIFAIYIHQIFKSDEDAHLHSHPWDFVSFILAGGYYEENQGGSSMVFLPGLWNAKMAHQYHRVTLLKPTMSLVFALGPRKPWGYYVDGNHVDNVTYRKMKNEREEV